ncbi:hypothetical protein C6501_16790 [Candidatus Poribacteria bacterium]|nr:MAG: hypothetical protein C6501_16790 [Candidatus Poribacteria bacterium]
MSNIVSNLKSLWTQGKFNWLFQLIVIFTVGLSLAIVGCGEDDNDREGDGDVTVGEVIVVQGVIVEDQTLTADNEYLLRGAVKVQDGVTLTIEPGATIYGESSTNGTLIIAQGAKIMADGTADAPIIMTSDKLEGSRARGQWGGLIINGKAPTNHEVDAFGEGNTGAFGGNNPNDNSGVLRYVRVEYAGVEFSPDNELNGIALQGVGSGTVIEYVQVHMNQDDGIEMFGGTVDLKYALVTGARDDSFDWTNGWTGKGQFWVAQQYGDDADNGFENDNSDDNNEALPRSEPTIFNVTLIGDPAGPKSDNGMLIREGAAGMYANLIVTGFNKVGLDVNTLSSHEQANNGGLVVKNSIFFENGKANFGDEKEDDGFDEAAWAKGLGNVEKDPNLAAPFNKDNPNFTPSSGTSSVTPSTPPSDSFFDSVNFIGGVDPANDWTIGWTTSARN